MASVTAVNCLGGYTHNPRGNLWLNDESTLGHKLLMKMGWRKGKGLGRNEDGIKENLKVKQKSGTSGVGWKDESFFNLQNTEYDSLLKSISEKCTPTDGSSNLSCQTKQENGSLEQRSQAFRNRLHYQKFVRGKDISRYSEKDMKCIFILNKTSEENTEKIVTEDLVSSTMEDSYLQDKMSNVLDTYNSKLSISDYFAQKMKGKKNVIKKSNNDPNLGPSENLEIGSSSVDKTQSAKIKKKYPTLTEADNYNSLNAEEPDFCKTKSSKKKRKRYEDLSNGNLCNSDVYKSSALSCDSVSKPIKKKKLDTNTLVGSVVSKENENSKESVVGLDLSPPNSIEILDNCLTANETNSVKKKLKKSKKHKHELNDNCLPVKETNCMKKNHNKSKKHKNDLNAFKFLKSCLKIKSGKHCLKSVSFNDYVSYRFIESNNNTQSISEYETSCPSEPEFASIEDDANKTEEIGHVAQKDTNQVEETRMEEESKVEFEPGDGCSLSKLPDSKSPIYTSWVESQRQGMKMKLYKRMFQNIGKHEILRTSNMLSIRGYGNWGY